MAEEKHKPKKHAKHDIDDAATNREKLWKVFFRFDTNHNGQISASELSSALNHETSLPFNEETARLMIGMFDKDHNSTINFEEFGELWKYIKNWKDCFKYLDQDGNGTIDKLELAGALRSFGYRLSDAFCAMLMHKFDRIGKGTITYDDFVQCCVTLHLLTSAFRSHDPHNDGWVTVSYNTFLQMVYGFA